MKRFLLSLSLVVLTGFAARANADQDYKAWNKYFAGSWHLQESGDQMELKCVGDGVVAVGTGTSATGEEVGGWIMGWDPADKVVVHEWFGNDHGFARYKIIDENTLRGPGEIHGSDKVTKGTVTLTRKSADTYTVHWTDVTANGKKADDLRVTVKRK